MNPQGNPEHQTEQIPVSDPVRAETLANVMVAQETIAATGCDTRAYNECTENFERQRAECREESCESRLALAQDMGVDGGSGTVQELSNLGKAGNVLSSTMLRLQYGNEVIDNGFDTQGNILGYNNEEGNYILAQQEIEEVLQVQNPEEWNSIALTNYFKYLDSLGSFDVGILLEKLGASKIISLGNLWKNQPNGPAMKYFQENKELSWIVDGVTSIDFKSMIFSGDMDSFQQISELFDVANEDDRDTMQDTIHNHLFDALDNGNVSQLRRISDIENIGGLHEGMYRFTISNARKMVLAHEAINSLGVLYEGGPDVGDIAKALILSSVNGVGIGENGEIQFSLDGINEIIQEYNTENNGEYPLLGDEYFTYLEGILNSNALIGEYSDNISRLADINTRISQLQSQIGDENIRPEEKEGIRRELYQLYSEQYGISREVSNNEGALEESFEDQAEYRKLLMSLTGSSIDIDVSREVHRNYILADPAKRLILLDNAEDLINLLPEINRTDIEIDNINPDFMTHPNVLRYMVQGDFRQVDFFKLPGTVFENSELCAIVGENKSHHWDTLFYNILLVQGAENSVDFVHDLIFNNPEIFRAEEDINILQKAIPRTIRLSDTEGKLENIPTYEPEISTATEFNNRVDNYISYFTDSEQHPELWNSVNPSGLASPIPQEAIIDTGMGLESTQGNDRENFQEYIRNYGISSEIYDSIRALIETGRLADIPLVFSGLDPNNQEELDLILLALDTYDVHYHFLSRGAQSHPQVLQKIGESGISSFVPNIISNITSEKLLARYLIGYQESGDDVGYLRNSSNFELLRRSIDSTKISNLTTEEVEILENFFQRRLEIEAMIDTLEGSLENINIEQRQRIINILEREGIIGLDESIYEVDFTDLKQVDSLLNDIGDRLEIKGKNDEQIKNIIQEILNINTQSARARVIITDREGFDVSPNMRGVLERHGFLLTEINTENFSINYDGIVEQYLESYRRENISEADLDSPEVISAYLLSLGLSTDEAKSIISNLQTRIQYEILRKAEGNYPQGESWKEGLENPPGLYGGTQARILQEIESGEYQYTPFEDSGIPESSTLPENWDIGDLSPDFQTRLKQDGDNFFLLSGGQEIPLSREDVSIIYNNPEAENNLIDAYNIFSREGLERIWEHRDAMMQSIGNQDSTGMTFNLRDGNYIDKREMNYLLSTILFVTTENVTYQNVGLRSLEDTISQVRKETQGAFGEENTRNIGQGENKLEESFINKFTMRNQGDEGRFNYTAFSKALKGDFSPSPQ